jgi:uncharacterized protein YpiB (UPF0302 family)
MENQIVSIDNKEKFIKYLLKNYILKRREAVWILNYMISHKEILNNVNFVTSVEGLSNSIKLNIEGNNNDILEYTENNKKTKDIEFSFHRMRGNLLKDFYMEVNFGTQPMLNDYIELLVELDVDTSIYSKYVEYMLEKSLIDQQINIVIEEIDESLISKNKNKFKILVKKSDELNKQLILVNEKINTYLKELEEMIK